MVDGKEDTPKQMTQPKKGEPVEIPVPTRKEWLRSLEKVVPPANRTGDTAERDQ